MAKLLIFLVAISFVEVLSDTRFRKSDLFLAQDAIQGLGDVAPEDLLPAAAISGDPSVDLPVSLQMSVLGGNHPNLLIAALHKEHKEDKEDVASPASPIISPKKSILPQKKEVKNRRPSTLSNIDPLFRLIKLLAQNASSISNGTSESLSELGDKGFIKRFTECMKREKDCPKFGVSNVKCLLHCMLKPHPIGKSAVWSVTAIIRFLCDPIGTIFDSGSRLLSKQLDSIQTTAQYLSIYKIAPQYLKRFTRYAINSVPTFFIKYSQAPQAMKLKKFLNDLEERVKQTKSLNVLGEEMNQLFNFACPVSHTMGSILSLVAAFYKYPKLFDIILAGSWTISKMPKLTSELAILNSVEAFGAGLNVASGLIAGCGMISKAETGKQPSCNGSEVIWWNKEKIVRAEGGKQVVCGSMPFFPTYIYDEFFSQIYYSENITTTTNTPKVSVNETKNDQVKPNENKTAKLTSKSNKLNFKLIDEILKADVEYD